jgi:hypothetical protein
MPRPTGLTVADGEEFSVGLFKVDRTDLLRRSKNTRPLHEKGNPATIRVLAADGNHPHRQGRDRARDGRYKTAARSSATRSTTVSLNGKELKPSNRHSTTSTSSNKRRSRDLSLAES